MADMVEVTRCKHCKYSKLLKDYENEKHIFRHCRIMNTYVADDNFCSYGAPQNDEVRE